MHRKVLVYVDNLTSVLKAVECLDCIGMTVILNSALLTVFCYCIVDTLVA